MRVLHAVHGFAPEFRGGVEAYVAAVAVGQRGRGREAFVLAGSDRSGGEPRVAEEEIEGVPVFRLEGLAPHPERLRDRPDGEALVRDLLRRLRPGVLHVHSWLRLPPNLAATAASEGVPTVATLHDLGLSCPRVHRLKAGLTFCRAPEDPALCAPCVNRDPWETDAEVVDELEQRAGLLGEERSLLAAVLVPSDAQRRLLEEVGAFPAGVIAVLPVALPELPRSRPEPARGAGGLAVGHWGNLLPAKGTHLLVEAAASLPAGLGVTLHIFGTAPDPAFDALLRATAPPERVVFHGPYSPEDLPGVLLDAAAFPALAHESHSFTLDEAFSLGLPVVVSDVGAPPERAGGRGLVVPAGDSRALASVLRRLSEEPGVLETLRDAAPADPPVPFASHLALLDEVYARVLRAGAPRRATAVAAGERLLALQRRASRRLEDAVAARDALSRLSAEATATVDARDVELRRLYDTEVALRAEAASLGRRLAEAHSDLETERSATGAVRGQLEALLSRRSVRLALRLARLLGRG